MKILTLKSLLISLALILGIVLTYHQSLVIPFLWNNENAIQLMTIHLSQKKYSMTVFYLPSNATSQDYVQIRKRDNTTGDESIAGNYERFQGIEKYRQLNNSLLEIILLDTASYTPRKDTVQIAIE